MYTQAKAGDIKSAFELAKDLVSEDAITKLADLIGDNDVDLNIVQAVKVSRTGSNGWHRLANAPSFSGAIDSKYVIMIGDTQTQGGTFASFKGHIESNGGTVIGSYAVVA